MAKRKLIVNPLGEVFLGGQYILGDISFADCPAAFERDADYNDTPKARGALKTALNRLLNESVLSDADKAMVKLVWRAQTKFNTISDIIRVGYWHGSLVVVTECLTFVDEVDFWKHVRKTAKNLGAYIYKMCENKHLDRSKRVGEKKWRCGPDHGRMERQVEIGLKVTEPTMAAISAAVEKLQKGTQILWQEKGVAVG